jgi:hypothetical protein
MKARFLTLALAFVGLFTLTSSFTPANCQLTPLTGNVGNCTFTGNFIVTGLSTEGGVITASGVLVGTIVNTTVNMDPTNDQVPVEMAFSGIQVDLEGTTCTSLTLNTEQTITLPSDCGNIVLDPLGTDGTITINAFPSRPGGNLNLIYNSLCAIGRWYENGNASERALIAHVNNLLKGVARLAP